MPETSICVRSLLVAGSRLVPVGAEGSRVAEPCRAAASTVGRDVEAAFGAAL